MNFRKMFVGTMLTAAVAASSVGMMACGKEEATVSSLALSGMDTEYTVGETFDSTITVNATMSDGAVVKINRDYEINEDEIDFSKPGKYPVFVTYKGITAHYTVTVVAPGQSLKALDADLTEAKTQYKVGETFSTDGIALIATYEYKDTGLDDTIEVVTDLTGYDVKVFAEDNTVIEAAFETAGTYSVVVAKGDVETVFDLTVIEPELRVSFEDAVAKAVEQADTIVSGEVTNHTYRVLGSSFDTSTLSSTFEFGADHLYLRSVVNEGSNNEYTREEWHSEDADGKSFGVWTTTEGNGIEEGLIRESDVYTEGCQFMPFGMSADAGIQYYGTEALVESLFNLVKEQNANYAFGVTETDGGTEEYTFEGMVAVSHDDNGVEKTNGYYVTVSFTLAENGAFDTVTVKTAYYTPEEDMEADSSSFYMTEQVTTVEQVVGERTAANPKSADKMQAASFDIKQGEDVVADAAKIETIINTNVTLDIAGVLPQTASLKLDPVKVTVAEEDKDAVNIVSWSNGFSLKGLAVGEYVVTIETAKVAKTLTLKVNYAPLTSFAAQVWNAGMWAAAASAKCFVNESVFVQAKVNANADASMTVAVDNPGKATVVQSEQNGKPCYEFKATEAGTYTITMTSAVDSEKTAEITVTVSEYPTAAEAAAILNGEYKGYAIGTMSPCKVEFTPDANVAGKGVVTFSGFDPNYWGSSFKDKFDKLTYTYDANTGAIEVERLKEEGLVQACFGLKIDGDGNVYYLKQNGNPIKMDKVEKPNDFVLGSNEIVITDAQAGTGLWYAFTAAEDGKYTMTVTSGNAYIYKVNNQFDVYIDGAGSYSFTLKAGGTFECMADVSDSSVGGTYTITIEKEEEVTPPQPAYDPEAELVGVWNNSGELSIEFAADGTAAIFIPMLKPVVVNWVVADEADSYGCYPITITCDNSDLVVDECYLDPATGEITLAASFAGTLIDGPYTKEVLTGVAAELIGEYGDPYGDYISFGETNELYFGDMIHYTSFDYEISETANMDGEYEITFSNVMDDMGPVDKEVVAYYVPAEGSWPASVYFVIDSSMSDMLDKIEA